MSLLKTNLPVGAWMEKRRGEVDPRRFYAKERPPARFRGPGAEYTLNPFRPAWGYHVGRKRGRSDPIDHVSAKELRAIDTDMPYGRSMEMARHLNRALPEHGARTPPQVGAFIAQAMTESDNFTDFEEDLYYRTPGLLRRRFPSRFPTVESEIPYRRNPEGMANYVYAARNGNYLPGDGFRYRGRGPIQVTGRENYRTAGYEDDPGALDDLATGFNASSAWWSAQGLPERTTTWLDRGDFDGVTRTVNGSGMTDADARWQDYQRVRAAMAWRNARQRTR